MTQHWIGHARALACSLFVLLAAPVLAQEPPADAGTEAAESAPLTADAVNTAEPGAGDAAMLRAQILLDRVHFSPGEIDARGGTNTTRAVAGFQRHHGLDATGELDARTWTALTEGDVAALVTHTLSAEDVAGPFATIPDDMMAQSKEDALGFESVTEALGERFHASPALLRRLNPRSDFAAGTRILVPNVAEATPLAEPARVVVSKSDSVVRLLDAKGAVYAQFPASTGTEHDPLPIGEWTIDAIAPDPTFHYSPDLFWDADPSHAKAVLPPGPNNPVGTVWIDLSKPHYGIHGTPEPANIGKTQSHGCVRMTNWSARRISDVVKQGVIASLEE